MIRAVAILVLALSACATARPAWDRDPQLVCTPPPAVAGVEWDTCLEIDDSLRSCVYHVGYCVTTMSRGECESPWYTADVECVPPMDDRRPELSL